MPKRVRGGAKQPSLKQSKKSRPARARAASEANTLKTPHLAWFSFQTPGKPPRRGSFQIVVQANAVEQALARCRARLLVVARDTGLFSSKTRVYLEGVIELRGGYEQGVLVNFESLEQPEVDVRLTCLIPEQLGHGVVGHGPTIEEADAVEPFIELWDGEAGASAPPAMTARKSSRPPLTARSRAEAS